MADSTNKRIRALTARIEALGGTVNRVTRNRHIKIYFTNARCEKHILTVAVSPSDWRANKDIERVLRRLNYQSIAYCQ